MQIDDFLRKTYRDANYFLKNNFPELMVEEEPKMEIIYRNHSAKGYLAGNDGSRVKIYIPKKWQGMEVTGNEYIINEGFNKKLPIYPSIFVSFIHEIVEVLTNSHEKAIEYEKEALKILIRQRNSYNTYFKERLEMRTNCLTL